jgi:glucosamine kinase
MSYFLGIDAGATKTQAALARNEEVLARVHGGSIKITRVGEEAAQRNLEEMLAALKRQSGVTLDSIGHTCVGLSGNAIASVVEWVWNALAAHVGGTIFIRGDEEIALDAAFQGGRGILAIAGTGSHIMGRTCGGEMFRTGGWGAVLSDQGAGSRIGLLAVRAVLHAVDAGEQTSMLPAVHAAWGTHTLEGIVDLGNRMPGPDFSQLAPIVARCSAEGDSTAHQVLLQSGEELADLVLLAVRKGSALEKCELPLGASMPWTVAYTGSAIEKISALRETMIAAILREQPATKFQSNAADPVLGALWRARQDSPIP